MFKNLVLISIQSLIMFDLIRNGSPISLSSAEASFIFKSNRLGSGEVKIKLGEPGDEGNETAREDRGSPSCIFTFRFFISPFLH